MPLIRMESSTLNKEQKIQLMKEVTESAANMLNMPAETLIVCLKENELDHLGTGGSCCQN